VELERKCKLFILTDQIYEHHGTTVSDLDLHRIRILIESWIRIYCTVDPSSKQIRIWSRSRSTHIGKNRGEIKQTYVRNIFEESNIEDSIKCLNIFKLNLITTSVLP
jgi:hypothetical protein